MTYDDFHTKLAKMKVEFQKATGREMKTISDLEQYLDSLLGRKKTRGLKSLKGLSL